MSAFVVATAGHVDHGKSTLVRALTGIEPDRWAEERRRGLTIDLGFAWTTLPSGTEVSFVDVPGHERFIGNMLAGLGPAPIVCFVIAADEGWREQSGEHRDALAALGIDRGLVAITRTDLAPHAVPEVAARARRELAGTGLKGAPVVGVSVREGTGLTEFTETLDAVLAAAPEADPSSRVRMWIDRAFAVSGAGTVVTGTLTSGTVRRGDRLDLLGDGFSGRVDVRGMHIRNASVDSAGPTNRVALNLRGISAAEVARGDAVVSPGAWWPATAIDVRRRSGEPLTAAAENLTAHVGTAAVPVRLRPFDAEHARLRFTRPLPLSVGDRLVLRDPGSRTIRGVQVLDADPPEFARRGDGVRRGEALAGLPLQGDVGSEVRRRGAVPAPHLRRLGLPVPAELPAASPAGLPAKVRAVGDWLVDEQALHRWTGQLRDAVEDLAQRDPVAGGLTRGAAQDLLSLPHPSLLDAVVAANGLEQAGGRIRLPGASGLGSAEPAVAELERRLTAHPFAAPEAHDLVALGLGARELAAAERQGRLLRLEGGVVVLPRTPAQAMQVLAGLEQPFTTSAARGALGTTRRVAIPLLEYLDDRGWTRRVDAGHRTVVR